MSRDLRQGDLDLLIGLSEGDVMTDARHQWTEPMVWVRNPSLQLDDDLPVPLVTFGDISAYHRLALRAFSKAERPYEVVFVGASEASIFAAVSSGLGVSVMPFRLAKRAGLEPWQDAPLPPVNDVYCGICLGENGDRIVLEELCRRRARPLVLRCVPASGKGSFQQSCLGLDSGPCESGSECGFTTNFAQSPNAGPSRSSVAPALPSPNTSRYPRSRAQAVRQRSGVLLNWACARSIRLPMPLLDATLSETTEPTKASAIATFSEPKK